ncbi:MAG: Levansucrase, partial [Sporolactobacillus laevolacticus]|nr:Levansucrase [Sporolactobacillus laevolacticus]
KRLYSGAVKLNPFCKKRCGVFLCFALILACSLPAISAQAKSSKTHHYYVTKTAYLYNSKSKKKHRLLKIPINYKLSTKSSSKAKLLKAKVKGKNGYVYKSKVTAKPKKVTRYVVKRSYLYSSNKKHKKRKATLPVNVKVKTTSALSSKMYHVSYKGKKGYIKKANLATKKVPRKNSAVTKDTKATAAPAVQPNNGIAVSGPSSNVNSGSTSNNPNQVAQTGTGNTSSDSNTMSNLPNSSTSEQTANSGSSQDHSSPATQPEQNQNSDQDTTDDPTATPSAYTETYGTSQITRYAVSQFPLQEKDSRYRMPNFDARGILNIPSAKDTKTLKDLDVWDSWPLQNPDGTVADYHGYHLVFALAGDPNNGNDTFIYLFYQKIGEQSLDSWKNAGRVFKANDKINSKDANLKNQTQEWSGSAILTNDSKDRKVRLFYTDFSGTSSNKQTLTTAQVNLLCQPNDTDTPITIQGVEDYKSIFDGGDGKLYQNIQQFVDEGAFSSGDNATLRDPHYVEDNGRKYLVFEGNTGSDDGYQGENSLYNKAYYGGSNQFFGSDQNKLLKSSKRKLASLANGALGFIELDDAYNLKKVMKPLITSNLVTDEIERANVFKFKGKWYLFTDTRGSKMALDNISPNMIYMLGYVSDHLTGPYKPLNGTGLVLASDESGSSRTFTYSHFCILPNNSQSNDVVVTSYMTNRGYFKNQRSTFAPSFLVTLAGDKTSVRQQKILEQGQLTTNDSVNGNNTYTQIDSETKADSNSDYEVDPDSETNQISSYSNR